MANLITNNLPNLRLMLNEEDYWDFYINHEELGTFSFDSSNLYDKCLISYIDTSLSECMPSGNTWLWGTSGYSWGDSFANENTLSNIGYTGFDNGLFNYRRDRISNADFVNYYTKSEYLMPSGDTRLKLHAVTGTTLLYDYPMSYNEADKSVKLNGGFYQGFFKTTDCQYSSLPTSMDIGDTWEFEFTLKKCDLPKESNKTLNDKYPDNKGIFFYLGTRAENKWDYLYSNGSGTDECFEIGLDDYVSGGSIDKNTYIINNFFNVNDYSDVEYKTDSDIFNLDDYTDYVHYADFSNSDENGTIDEILSNCCHCNDTKTSVKTVYELVSNGCGCGNRYRKKGEIITEPYVLTGCDTDALDDYLCGLDDMNCDTDYIADELDISDFTYETDNGFNINSANDYYFYTDNKYMMFDRTPDGYTVDNWTEGTKMMYYGKKDKFTENLFVLMNRTKTGYTVEDIDILRDKANSTYDSLYSDLYGNAFALRIKDDGSIGYKYLVKDCSADTEGKYSILEGYSYSGIIPDCEWTTVHVKMECAYENMKMYFYVGGKLIYVTKDLPKINLHALDEISEKQEGVPYNISIGGGTQGLAETVLPNYMLDPYRVYPLEENFGGSFIGYFKSFKFYDCKMEYGNILSNYKFELKNFSI
jgi:hypothetical protein